MKKFLILTLTSFLIFSCQTKIIQESQLTSDEVASEAPKVSEEFVQGSEDIPLLMGMEKMFEENLGFDSLDGSIVSSSYDLTINSKEVKKFYLETLPQMGWNLIKNTGSKLKFKRDNENLEIEFQKNSNKNIVRFFISTT